MAKMSCAEVEEVLREQKRDFANMGVESMVSPILAYPYGVPPGSECIEIFKEMGFIGAVLAYPGNYEMKYQKIDQYIYDAVQPAGETDPFYIPRVSIGAFTYVYKDGKYSQADIDPIDDFKKDVEDSDAPIYHIK